MNQLEHPRRSAAAAAPNGSTRRTSAQLAESPVSLRRVVALFRPHRTPVAIVTLIIVAISIISMAQPFLLRAVIDEALPHQDVRLLLWAVGGMLAATVVTQLLGVVQTWMTTSVGQRVMHGLRTDVFRHLQRQSVAFFTRTRSGEVQSRLTHDISGMQSVITSTATSIASNVTTAIATAVAMVALSPRLSLLSLHRHPAGDLDDTASGAAPAGHHDPAPAPPRRPAQPGRGGPHRQRRDAHQDSRCVGAPRRTASPRPRPTSSTSSCAPSSPGAGGWRRCRSSSPRSPPSSTSPPGSPRPRAA